MGGIGEGSGKTGKQSPGQAEFALFPGPMGTLKHRVEVAASQEHHRRGRWDQGLSWGRAGRKVDSVSPPVASLLPLETRVAWKQSWTQAFLSSDYTRKHKGNINRGIQVSKGPSGSLATRTEVGQCPHWVPAKAARHCWLP